MRITLSDRNPSDHQTVWFSGYESMLAGAGAGLVTSVVTCPLDVIKTKLQASGGALIPPAPSRGITGERRPPFLASPILSGARLSRREKNLRPRAGSRGHVRSPLATANGASLPLQVHSTASGRLKASVDSTAASVRPCLATSQRGPSTSPSTTKSRRTWGHLEVS